MKFRHPLPRPENLPSVSRMPTGIPGLDAVLDGGLPSGRTCLVAGPPGTGKTTLANHLAFQQAAAGGSVVYATLLAESHDLMLQNVRDFAFYDRSIPGDRIRYLSLLPALEGGGPDAVLQTIRKEVREAGATLLIVDGAAIFEDLAPAAFDIRRFAQQLETHAALLGCTTVLLTSHEPEETRPLGAHVNGVILLAIERVDSQHRRVLEVVKMRGARHAGGTHEFAITRSGMVIHPRIESLVGDHRPGEAPGQVLKTGVDGLDAMLGGGLLPFSSTLVVGTPGAGKTLLGLSFLAEGAKVKERGLIAGFHETTKDLIATAEGIGLDLAHHIERGQLRVQWDPPLELSVDAWAWKLFATIDQHKPQRVFIDAITDVQRLMVSPQRLQPFITALINELRVRGTTAMIAAEIDAYIDQQLAVPLPSASATMDNGILLRQVELGSELRRLISVLKARQTRTDPTIREFVIGPAGLTIGEPFGGTSHLLTGDSEVHGNTNGAAS
jgi:circadian clock protein KaiC